MRAEKNEQPNHNIYECTQCGGGAEVGYSNWSKAGEKKKVVGKKERLCGKCFKERMRTP